MIKKNKIALVCGGSYGLGIEITKYGTISLGWMYLTI